jgi:polysaccharide deacetylase family protein (PEP-CTERM system associated)
MIPGGDRLAERVPRNVERFVVFLARHRMRATFFTVGEVARRYPSLVRELAGEGHEIACHSSDHVTLDRHDPASFRDDLARNLDDLAKAGARDVRGFRAPVFSLNARTAWAYRELKDLGFSYSSSVLPAMSPLYGWPGVEPEPHRIDSVWEIPLTLANIPGLRVPVAGGIYFRILPFWLIRYHFRQQGDTGKPLVGYFHPYDVDTEQEPLMHPRLNGNPLLNWLMYRNRKAVFPRLEKLIASGARIVTYSEFIVQLQHEQGAPRFTL